MELKNKLKNQAKSGDSSQHLQENIDHILLNKCTVATLMYNVMNGQESNCDNGTNTIVFRDTLLESGKWSQLDSKSGPMVAGMLGYQKYSYNRNAFDVQIILDVLHISPNLYLRRINLQFFDATIATNVDKEINDRELKLLLKLFLSV